MYSNTATLKLNDHTALFALAQMHKNSGVYDPSCGVTNEDKAVYRAFFKLDFEWSVAQIKAAIVKQKMT